MSEWYDTLPSQSNFDESKYRLGKLCKREHDWMGTGQSLRAISGKCSQCRKEKYQANLEENRRSARERMKKVNQSKVQFMTPHELQQYRISKSAYVQRRHQTIGRKSRAKGMESFFIPPHFVGTCITASDLQPFITTGWDLNQLDPATVAESRDQWRQMRQAIQCPALSPSVARLVMNEQQRYWRENPDAYREHGRQWGQASWWLKYQTRPELRLYTRQKTSRRKALERGSVGVHVKGRQIKERFAEFGHRCAYCNATRDLHIEHVVPISKGGTNALGNILPACLRCNYSKGTKEVESWYRAQPFFTTTRWRKICRVLGWNRSSVGQLALL